MLAYARPQNLNDAELFARIQAELVNRYSVDEKLASEMAWDFLEVLSAVDGDIDIFEKYFLH
jgi:hypothetical protein